MIIRRLLQTSYAAAKATTALTNEFHRTHTHTQPTVTRTNTYARTFLFHV